MQKRTTRAKGTNQKLPKPARAIFSKSWLESVKIPGPGFLLGSGGTTEGVACLMDWGSQSNVAPGTDGTPGYDISRAAQYSTEQAEDGDGNILTSTGWNAVVTWKMSKTYLDTLSIHSSGIIGRIYQDVYYQGFNAGEAVPDSYVQMPRRDCFSVYCRLVYSTRIGGSTTNNSPQRYYSVHQGPKDGDIFLLPDDKVTFPKPIGYDSYIMWGIAYFIPEGSQKKAGNTARRFLSIELGSDCH